MFFQTQCECFTNFFLFFQFDKCYEMMVDGYDSRVMIGVEYLYGEAPRYTRTKNEILDTEDDTVTKKKPRQAKCTPAESQVIVTKKQQKNKEKRKKKVFKLIIVIMNCDGFFQSYETLFHGMMPINTSKDVPPNATIISSDLDESRYQLVKENSVLRESQKDNLPSSMDESNSSAHNHSHNCENVPPSPLLRTSTPVGNKLVTNWFSFSISITPIQLTKLFKKCSFFFD